MIRRIEYVQDGVLLFYGPFDECAVAKAIKESYSDYHYQYRCFKDGLFCAKLAKKKGINHEEECVG